MNTAFNEQEALGLMLAGSIVTLTLVIVALIAYIISAIGYWRMFKKAGSAGWKAFVPFVNTYEMYRLSWDAKYFWPWFFFSVVSAALFYCAEMIAGGTALAFLPDALAYAASAAALYYVLKMNNLLARSFGKGNICGVCLWVFPFITSLVLGFGSARYIGNQSK